MRGPRRHFTHSKVLAWVAFDRAVKSVEQQGQRGPVDRWRRIRDAIRDDVCRHGFSARQQAFTQSYGSDALDASVLMLPLVGFLAGRRSADDGHHRGHRAPARARRLRPAVRHRRGPAGPGRDGCGPHDRRPAPGRGRVPRVQLLARRQLRAAPAHARGRAPGSIGCSGLATTSACSPRSTIPSRNASSATSRRPSVTSA